MDNQLQVPDWKTRRVLVTGANGFIGRWLAPVLSSKGAHVVALVRKRDSSVDAHFSPRGVRIAEGDITGRDRMSRLIADEGIDTVYHLAATNINIGANISPYDVFEANIRGVYTVLDACRTSPTKARAIVSSSKEVEDCFQPTSRRKHHPYMTSKAAAEMVARAYNDTFGVGVTLLRSDNVYGGGDFNWARLVPGTIRSVLKGETPVIRSNGKLQRDYIYVEDAVEAYVAIGERIHRPDVAGQLFRIATGKGTSVLTMVEQIAKACGKPDLKPRVLNETTEERIDTFYTPELERSVLGWENRYSLEQGLARTCDWYRRNSRSVE